MKILTKDNPILRQVSKDVIDFDSIKTLVNDMENYLRNNKNAIGLTAVQVGQPLNVFSMKLRVKPYEGRIITLINPKVIGISEEMIQSSEGCLSCPGIYVTIERHKEILVKYSKVNGSVIEWEFKGGDALCVQQEMDHLKGKLIIDYQEEKL